MSFTAHPHRLSATAKAKLTAVLGDVGGNVDPDAIYQVEKWLGFYVNAADNADEIPRPSDYVATYKPISQLSLELLNAVTGLSDYYRQQLKTHNADFDEVHRVLATLHQSADAIVEENKSRKSSGARKHTALAFVIQNLRTVFDGHYKGTKSNRRKQELKFVEAALLDARIIKFDFASELPRLFLDPRCTILVTEKDTDTVIDELAEKFRDVLAK